MMKSTINLQTFNGDVLLNFTKMFKSLIKKLNQTTSNKEDNAGVCSHAIVLVDPDCTLNTVITQLELKEGAAQVPGETMRIHARERLRAIVHL